MNFVGVGCRWIIGCEAREISRTELLFGCDLYCFTVVLGESATSRRTVLLMLEGLAEVAMARVTCVHCKMNVLVCFIKLFQFNKKCWTHGWGNPFVNWTKRILTLVAYEEEAGDQSHAQTNVQKRPVIKILRCSTSILTRDYLTFADEMFQWIFVLTSVKGK